LKGRREIMEIAIEEVKKKVEEFYYWDAKLIHLACEYFGDEVTLVYDEEDGNYVVYRFLECYKSDFYHLIDYPKNVPYKDLVRRQIPFSMQNVDILVDIKDGKELYIFNINAHPLYLEIWCKDIELSRQKKEDCDIVKLKK